MPSLTIYCSSCERPIEAADRGDEFLYPARCPDCASETHLVVLSGPVRVKRDQDEWRVSALTPEEVETAAWCGAPSSSQQVVAPPVFPDDEPGPE
jgi:hypothetical protein